MIVYLESLGCSRNQVDSEIMLGKLITAGHTLTKEADKAEAIIVNTCGFISSASDEAVDIILEMAAFKKKGICQRLIVAGCLVQRYSSDPALVSSLPEVDAFLGTAACDKIVEAVEDGRSAQLSFFPDSNSRKFQNISEYRELTEDPFSYVKISEGCNRTCTYCIIPTLRGKQRSRPAADICTECRMLVEKGKQEIILTAENTTDWGMDLRENPGFSHVLSKVSDTLSQADPDAWLRFLYIHPSSLKMDIVQTVRDRDNLCSYYDIPIQHAVTPILKRMGRPYTREDLLALFEMIRKKDPQAVLRTSIIVGFPGETERNFKELLQFVKDIRFDHLGVFIYSDSQDIPSHRLSCHVSKSTAEARRKKLLSVQASISRELNQARVGKIYSVLVEKCLEPGFYIGRTMFQTPEVDGVSFVYAEDLQINTKVKVKITNAYEYDIVGELV